MQPVEGGVISIVEPGASSAVWLRLAAQCGARVQCATLVLGTGADAATARDLGADVAAWTAPPVALAQFGRRSVRREFAPRVGNRAVIAWSPAAAAAALGMGVRVLFVACARPGAHGGNALLSALRSAQRSTQRGAGSGATFAVLPADDAVAESWRQVGAFEMLPACTVLPECTSHGDRLALRAAWDVQEGEWVVGLVGGPPATLDAQRAVDIVARATIMCGTAGPRPFVVLAHPDAANMEVAIRWAEDSPELVRLVRDRAAERIDSVAAGLDCALWASARGASAPACEAWLAARLGVPVIAEEGSLAAPAAATMPGRTFPARRSTTGAHAVAHALGRHPQQDGAQHQSAQRHAAEQLRGPGALAEKIAQWVSRGPGQAWRASSSAAAASQ